MKLLTKTTLSLRPKNDLVVLEHLADFRSQLRQKYVAKRIFGVHETFYMFL